ncbi:MAG TPA: NAD(P)-dependent oxidoreductase [Gemmatimonadales bacterium]|jgi:nucleoside-diphosphate-sugar epimerase|nr:NAD(P)-dependent oxidoreductase [Gemmatimonadales bacterium]
MAGLHVFVAGATGVIGRRAIPQLIAAGHRVTAVGRSPEKRAALERLGAATVAVDLFDAEALRRAVAGHDVVINVATHIPPTSRMLLPWAWRENDRIRRVASANLVEGAIAAGAARFIQESFAPVYPDMGDRWIDESTPISPTAYNRTVADAERAVVRFTDSAGDRTGIVLRFAAFYGPDAEHVRAMMRFVRRGWAPLPGPDGAYFSSISHDDAASAVVAALEVRAGTYNVADNEPLTRRAYVDALAAALGVPPPRLPPPWVTRLLGSLGETLARSHRISNKKLRGERTWTPRYPSVREGWQAMLAETRG